MSALDRKAVTGERLRELLHYDPETGVFTWRVGGRRARLGEAAGCVETCGYLRITIDGRQYYAHRLAWLYVTGAWPADQLDHRDGDRTNNRFDNLREATHAENGQNRTTQKNNTSGFAGVHWHLGDRRWHARIRVGGRRVHLGSFDTPEEAHAAYIEAKARLHDFQPVPRTLGGSHVE